MAMIKLTGINKIYRTNEIETLALENVNLDVAKGEFVSIMGPSGCGKSTLLNIMGLLDAPSSGKIEINGTSVESMKDKELAAFRNKTLGFVFQSFHLINSLNVIDNVELPLLYRKMAAKERTRLAKEVLERVGLSHRMRKRMSEIGVRKAFGATANVLLRQVFYENLLLTLIAGAVGMLFSYACTFLLNDFLFSNSENRAQIGETSLSADMLFSPWIFLAAFIFCLLLNLLSACIPAWRASRMNITDALNQR